MTVGIAVSPEAPASVAFGLTFAQKLTVVTLEAIKIDHNAFVNWTEVALAEEK